MLPCLVICCWSRCPATHIKSSLRKAHCSFSDWAGNLPLSCFCPANCQQTGGAGESQERPSIRTAESSPDGHVHTVPRLLHIPGIWAPPPTLLLLPDDSLCLKMQEVNFSHWEKLSPPGLCPHPPPGHRKHGQQAPSFLLLLRDEVCRSLSLALRPLVVRGWRCRVPFLMAGIISL